MLTIDLTKQEAIEKMFTRTNALIRAATDDELPEAMNVIRGYALALVDLGVATGAELVAELKMRSVDAFCGILDELDDAIDRLPAEQANDRKGASDA